MSSVGSREKRGVGDTLAGHDRTTMHKRITHLHMAWRVPIPKSDYNLSCVRVGVDGSLVTKPTVPMPSEHMCCCDLASHYHHHASIAVRLLVQYIYPLPLLAISQTNEIGCIRWLLYAFE